MKGVTSLKSCITRMDAKSSTLPITLSSMKPLKLLFIAALVVLSSSLNAQISANANSAIHHLGDQLDIPERDTTIFLTYNAIMMLSQPCLFIMETGDGTGKRVCPANIETVICMADIK